MEKDTIISLGEYEFALLDEVILDNQKYFFAVQMVKGTDNITDNYFYFKEVIVDGEICVVEEKDDEILEKLIVIFTGNYVEEVEGEYNEN